MTESVKTAPVPPVPAKPTVTTPFSAAVSSAVARTSPLVSKLAARTKSTTDIESPWARILIHGEVDSWKTTTAAGFSPDPEDIRFIVTRGEDQMLPLRSRGIKYVKIDNGQEASEALSHCDHVWPDWAKRPEPVLVVDDTTRLKDFIVAESKFYESGGQIKEYKDTRKIYGQALAEFDSIFTTLNKKPIHIILTALSAVKEGKISLEETVAPDLPQGIGNFVISDYSFVLFLNKKKPFESRMLTSMDKEAVTEYSDSAKQNITYQRYYFARHKIDASLRDKGIVKLYEPADLRVFWNKIKAARGK